MGDEILTDDGVGDGILVHRTGDGGILVHRNADDRILVHRNADDGILVHPNADDGILVHRNADDGILVRRTGGEKVYDASGYGPWEVPFGGEMFAGDKIINVPNGVGTILLLSDNLEGTNDQDWLAARCVLQRLGFSVPKTGSGIYWAQMTGDRKGSTVTFYTFADYPHRYSFLNYSMYAVSSSPATPGLIQNFEDFIETVWHEAKGRNVDGVQGDTAADQYDAQVKAALDKLRAIPISTCRNGHPIHNALEVIYYDCGVQYWGTRNN